MRIARRLFVVLLGDDAHGKTSMLRALAGQAEAYAYLPPHPQKEQDGRPRAWISPWGRHVNAYLFPRSYQEREKQPHGSVEGALDANDRKWRDRELIIMPSHVTDIVDDRHKIDDIDQMIEAANGAGFDIICATVLFVGTDDAYEPQKPQNLSSIWKKNWDERWTIPNKRFVNASQDDPRLKGQVEALGRDLWTWICRALAS